MTNRSLRDILKPVKDVFHSERRSIRYIVALTLLFNIFLIMIPFSVQVFINQLAIQVYQGATLALFALFAALVVVVIVLRLAQLEILERLERRIFVKAALHFGNSLSAMTKRASNRLRPQESFHRFFEVFNLEKALAKSLVDGIQFIMQIILGLAIVSFYHQFFLFYSVLILVSMTVLINMTYRRIIELGVETSDKKYKFLSWLEQVSFNRNLFYSETGHTMAMEKISQEAESWLSSRDNFFKSYFKQVKGIFLVQIIGGVFFLSIGGFLVFQQNINLGQFVAAEIIVTYVLLALGTLPRLLENIYGAIVATYKLYSGVEGEKLLPSGQVQCSPSPHSWQIHDIAAVSSATGPLFKGISLDVAPKEHFAVLAPNSSGKSSFCQLLLRYRGIESGEIFLDGVPLANYDLRSLHERVCLVTNEPHFFVGTIDENITYNLHPKGEIVDIMKALNLHQLFLRYEDQLDTPLSMHGSPLSENESKGLMLVRALLQRRGTIVFDDVLDDLASNVVDQLLLYLRTTESTVIVTTSKKSIAEKMDRIYEWKTKKTL